MHAYLYTASSLWMECMLYMQILHWSIKIMKSKVHVHDSISHTQRKLNTPLQSHQATRHGNNTYGTCMYGKCKYHQQCVQTFSIFWWIPQSFSTSNCRDSLQLVDEVHNHTNSPAIDGSPCLPEFALPRRAWPPIISCITWIGRFAVRWSGGDVAGSGNV